MGRSAKEKPPKVKPPSVRKNKVDVAALAAVIRAHAHKPAFVSYTTKLTGALDQQAITKLSDMWPKVLALVPQLAVCQTDMKQALKQVRADQEASGAWSRKMTEPECSHWAEEKAKQLRSMLRALAQARSKKRTWVNGIFPSVPADPLAEEEEEGEEEDKVVEEEEEEEDAESSSSDDDDDDGDDEEDAQPKSCMKRPSAASSSADAKRVQVGPRSDEVKYDGEFGKAFYKNSLGQPVWSKDVIVRGGDAFPTAIFAGGLEVSMTSVPAEGFQVLSKATGVGRLWEGTNREGQRCSLTRYTDRDPILILHVHPGDGQKPKQLCQVFLRCWGDAALQDSQWEYDRVPFLFF